jgi:flagellar protein FlaG
MPDAGPHDVRELHVKQEKRGNLPISLTSDSTVSGRMPNLEEIRPAREESRMDFAAASKPFATGAVQTVIRTDIAVQTGAIPVELSAEKTVRSVSAGDPVQLDIRARANEQRQDDARQRQDNLFQERRFDELRRQQNLREVIDRRIEIDPKTRAIVLRKTNRDTGEVVDQLPDETMLKLRAYSRAIIERNLEAEADRSHEVERLA